MTIKKFFKKAVVTVFAAATIITAASGFTSLKAEAASMHVIADENACACIREDGSGFIECYKEFTKDDPLTQIDGVALKDIITFNDGGYVDSYYHTYTEHRLGKNVVFQSDETAYIHGCGPEGLFSGSGYVQFTDDYGTYDTSFWSHDAEWKSVDYKSFSNQITKISWNS